MKPIDCEIQCACGSALFYPCNSTSICQYVGIYFYCIFPAFRNQQEKINEQLSGDEMRSAEKRRNKNNRNALTIIIIIMLLALLFFATLEIIFVTHTNALSIFTSDKTLRILCNAKHDWNSKDFLFFLVAHNSKRFDTWSKNDITIC